MVGDLVYPKGLFFEAAMIHKWKTFFGACFRKRFLYDAVLPYNLFWRITGKQCQPFLRNHPIEVLDVGCRGECPPELAGLSPSISYTGLEADIDECIRLRKSRLPFARASFLPFAVSGRPGKALLRVNREPGTSSFLPVDPLFRERFGGEAYETLRTRVLDTTSLDHLARLKHVPQPDFLKIDTQGTELQILAGGRRMLEKTTLVEIEVEFEAIYRGQSLFHHVNDFMLKAGFRLLYLNRVFAGQRGFSGATRGQLIFGDALYGKKEAHWDNLSAESKIKMAVLLANFGHRDIAARVFEKYPDLQQACPQFQKRLKQSKPRLLQSLEKSTVSLLDKLLVLLLLLRGYNRRSMESDRSWPTR
jgi:hypothetical protein